MVTTTDTEVFAGVDLDDEVPCSAFYDNAVCTRPAVYRAIFDCSNCDRGSSPLCEECQEYFQFQWRVRNNMIHHRIDDGWVWIREILSL